MERDKEETYRREEVAREVERLTGEPSNLDSISNYSLDQLSFSSLDDLSNPAF